MYRVCFIIHIQGVQKKNPQEVFFNLRTIIRRNMLLQQNISFGMNVNVTVF